MLLERAKLAMNLGEEKPLRYRAVKDVAKKCESFENVDENSMGRVLTRVLIYLEKSGLIIKTWSSRRAVSFYFRIYRTIEPKKPIHIEWEMLKELEKEAERLVTLLKILRSRCQEFKFSA